MGWIAIDSQLPKPMQIVLTYDDVVCRYETLCLVDEKEKIWANSRGEIVKASPTYWKKLLRKFDPKKLLNVPTRKKS